MQDQRLWGDFCGTRQTDEGEGRKQAGSLSAQNAKSLLNSKCGQQGIQEALAEDKESLKAGPPAGNWARATHTEQQPYSSCWIEFNLRGVVGAWATSTWAGFESLRSAVGGGGGEQNVGLKGLMQSGKTWIRQNQTQKQEQELPMPPNLSVCECVWECVCVGGGILFPNNDSAGAHSTCLSLELWMLTPSRLKITSTPSLALIVSN